MIDKSYYKIYSRNIYHFFFTIEGLPKTLHPYYTPTSKWGNDFEYVWTHTICTVLVFHAEMLSEPPIATIQFRLDLRYLQRISSHIMITHNPFKILANSTLFFEQDYVSFLNLLFLSRIVIRFVNKFRSS